MNRGDWPITWFPSVKKLQKHSYFGLKTGVVGQLTFVYEWARDRRILNKYNKEAKRLGSDRADVILLSS